MGSSSRGSGFAVAARLAVAVGLIGCTPVTPTIAPPTVLPTATPTTAPTPTAAPPSASPIPSPAPASFIWSARPDVFAGEDGASLTNVAAGPAGVLALSVRGPDQGGPSTLLWGSPDGLTWKPIQPKGLQGQVFISGLWGAGGQYWLRGHFPDSDDPGRLFRSSDGVTWRPSRNLSAQMQSWAVVDGCDPSAAGALGACPVFLTGTRDVDGAIWRSTDGGETWTKASVEDATGWQGTQDAAPVEIRGVVRTQDGLLAYGNGLPKATDTGGYLQARFWRSSDAGATWRRVPNAAPLGELYVEDVLARPDGVSAVGRSVDESIAVALRSTDGGGTWSLSATSGAREDGILTDIFATGDSLVGLGYADPAGVDTFPVQENVWTSWDGSSWVPGPAGDLEGGIVDDAVSIGDRIVAVGRAWTTDATGTWDAPFGPAVWVLP